MQKRSFLHNNNSGLHTEKKQFIMVQASHDILLQTILRLFTVYLYLQYIFNRDIDENVNKQWIVLCQQKSSNLYMYTKSDLFSHSSFILKKSPKYTSPKSQCNSVLFCHFFSSRPKFRQNIFKHKMLDYPSIT